MDAKLTVRYQEISKENMDTNADKKSILHYWNQPNNSSPWYSNVRLFPFNKKWEATVKDIKVALEKKFNQ